MPAIGLAHLANLCHGDVLHAGVAIVSVVTLHLGYYLLMDYAALLWTGTGLYGAAMAYAAVGLWRQRRRDR